MIELTMADLKTLIIGPAYAKIGEHMQRIGQQVWTGDIKVEIQPVDEIGAKIGTVAHGFFEPNADSTAMVMRLPYAVFEIEGENSLAAFIMTEKEHGFGLVCTAPLKVARSFPGPGRVKLTL